MTLTVAVAVAGGMALLAVVTLLVSRGDHWLAPYARAARTLATDRRVPWPCRVALILAVLPIPGPQEEIAGALAIGWLLWRRRGLVTEALANANANRKESR